MLALLRTALSLVFLFAAGANAGIPETPRLRQMTVADGLPSNIIYKIAQDHDGFLWLATADGLVRYDGTSFRVWQLSEGLRENVVTWVAVDADNRIWLGTLGAGMAVLDRGREQFRYFNKQNTPGLGDDEIVSLLPADDGSIWIGTNTAGLHRMSRDGQLTSFMPRPGDERSLPGRTVTNLQRDVDGRLWVGTDHGAARWTGTDFERLPKAAHPSMYVASMQFDHAGNLWLGTELGMSVYRADGSWSQDPWGLHRQMSVHGLLLQDSAGVHWLNTYDGMRRSDEDRATLSIPLYSNLTHGRVKPQWSDALQDGEGGLWFASIDAGVWYLPPTWRQFSVLAKTEGVRASLGNNQVYSIAPSATGDMWLVGTSGVLDRLDPETGLVRHVLDHVGEGTVTYAVAETADGGVWVGYSEGLVRYDPASGAVRRWNAHSGKEAAGPDIDAIAQAADGKVWLGQGGYSLQVRSPEGRVIDSLSFGERGLVAGDTYHQLSQGPDGRIWLANRHGIVAWDADAARFVPVSGLPQVPVGAFAQGEGLLWLARVGALEAYRQQDGQYRRVERLDAAVGMPQMMLKGLTVDRRGILWAGSTRGLTRIDPVRHQVRVYGIHDGLPGQEILSGPFQRPQDGRIVVSASHGLVIFDPIALRPMEAPPPLVLDAITVRRKSQPLAMPADRPFQLEYDDRDLRVVARLISYSNVQGHRYRSRLSGFDSDWVETDASGVRTFSRLPPGDYQLEIAGKNADNVWSKTQAIVFTVASPWWRTWWAIILWVALAITLLGWLALDYRRRLRRRSAWRLTVHKRELAEQASEAKTRFLATLGHEVRTPMTGVLGMSELLLATPLNEQQQRYTTAIQRAGTHLVRLVNDALDLARIEAGKLDLQAVDFDLHMLINDIAALMAPVAKKKALAFSSEIAPSVPRMVRSDPLRLRQILLNLIGNAVKFTEHGGVALRIAPLSSGSVRLQVSDSGPGINAEQQARLFQRFEQAEGARTTARYGGSGLGLAICEELAVAMGGHIEVESSPGAGARFTVDLPMPRSLAIEKAGKPAEKSVAVARAPALKILLVEDDPTVAEVVAGLLRARGHHVTHAAHGLAALSEVSVGEFDIALLDLDLPGLDGLALAQQLRMRGFAAPLIAITARADAEAETQTQAAGFDGFLRKPVTGDELAEAIERVLQKASGADTDLDS